VRLADVMSHPPNLVTAETPAEHCVALMVRLGVRHLPVVDTAGVCIGLLTDHELRHHRTWVEEGFDGACARHLLREVEVILSPAAAVPDALRRLDSTAQDAVLVARDDRVPVGIFTELDAMRLAAGHLPTTPLPISDEPLPLLPADTPANDGRSWLVAERLLHALVVRGEQLVGVLSFRDVAVADDLADHLTVADVASRPMATRQRLTARAVAQVLAQRRIGCLPLVDEAWRPIDITTRREIMRALADELIGR